MSLSIRTSRLVLDFVHSPKRDKIAIEAWRGNPLLVPLSLFDDDEVADLTSVTNLNMAVFAAQGDLVPLMFDSKSSFTADDGLGAGSCCVFDFTSLECALNVDLWDGPETYREFLVWIYAIDTDLPPDDQVKTVARGTLSMWWDGDPSELGPPPVIDAAYITSAVANARYVRFDAAQSLNNTQLWRALNNLGITYDDAQGALLLNLPTANGGTQVRISLDTVS